MNVNWRVYKTGWQLAMICSILAVTVTAVAVATEKENLRKSLNGQTPPELVSAREHWLGKSTPTTLEQLKGNVVWLQFNF
jgi:hypothetical protein